MKLAGLVEYDGTDFSGWAAQPGQRTVEGSLSEALGTILRQPVKLSVAGRTDAGVHASGQVVSFEAETELSPAEVSYKTTAVLPPDVALRRCAPVSHDFDARKSARSRSYEYRVLDGAIRSPLLRRYTSRVPKSLDTGLLDEAAGLVRGTHDFRAFTPSRSYHSYFVRKVTESLWERRGEVLVYRITADAFLYGMVRTLVGTMREVAEGRRSLGDFASLLGGADERSRAGPSAPPQGLTLVRAAYEEQIV
ncbi:MAG: tRNA pseudouridine(38-40) synthase TruA [Rubrobacter sp.]|nr:tRNA pseudouridine(38-40) synthase TruA [Rubrobacter sp.]